MRLTQPDGAHLTYCTNIHPGEAWSELRAALTTHVPAVRDAVAPGRPFGVGLRIAKHAAEDLENWDALSDLREILKAENLYVVTVNGFPFGAFHGQRVKQGVYDPDWRTAARRIYSTQLARHLTKLLPDGIVGSVSTVPGAFKPKAESTADVDAIVENLLAHAADLQRLRDMTGKTVVLALEPEPACFLETTDEAIAFFRERLFSRSGVTRFAEMTGLNPGRSEAALRRHLGVCFDVCHAAVEFEDPSESLDALHAAGIAVPKVQISAALCLPEVDGAAVARLRDFADGVYLHQVVSRTPGGRLTRYLDLPEAFAAFDAGAEHGNEWRIHFHVPVFRAELDGFASTQPALTQALAWLAQHGGVPHLEVETYTWNVLPERHRGEPVERAIARELTWSRDGLAA